MDFVLISLVAFLASLLTFFSGFGLGTILTPFLVLFFPVEVAIALTGIVHFLNNIFKIALVRQHIHWSTAWRFGGMAFLGAFLGASLLIHLSSAQIELFTYQLGEKTFTITLIKLSMAVLMLVFVLFEIIPALSRLQFERKHLMTGGFISGFFGGLSGNQGALRSMFLLRSGLNKEAYIATGILIACFVDVSRLGVYIGRMEGLHLFNHGTVLGLAIASAFLGAWAGSKFLKKVTFKMVQGLVTGMIALLAIGLGLGWL